jgi:hypothetical protein
VANVAIINPQVVAVPSDYKIPGAQELLPLSVRAVFDGTGAASAYFPLLQILDGAGNVLIDCVATVSVAAGVSADATWFPGVTGTTDAASIAVVGARIEMHATQSVSSSTNTDLTYDTVAFDTGGFANLGVNNRILTAPAAGLYAVICERAWPYNNSGRRLVGITHNNFYATGGALLSNNSAVSIWASPVGGSGGAPQTTNGITTLVQAAAGDFFATGANQDSGGALTTGGGAAEYFSAILLGKI